MVKKRKNDILYHELLRQASMAVYGKGQYPTNYEIHSQEEFMPESNTGFYADILVDKNDVIIACRGTELTSLKDLKNDIDMLRGQIPEQAINALYLLNKVEEKYGSADITITGHSLGGSVSQIVGALRDVDAVTFNAYGVKNLFTDSNNLNDANIINYINEFDPVAMINAKNHVGDTYSVKQDKYGFSHAIENMGDLTDREYVSSEDLETKENIFKNRYENIKDYIQQKGNEAKETFEANIKTIKNKLPRQSQKTHNKECVGTYPVSSYTRSDGTEVKGYTRSCGAKHAASQSQKSSIVDPNQKVIIDERWDNTSPKNYSNYSSQISTIDLLRGIYKGRNFDRMSSFEIERMIDDLI